MPKHRFASAAIAGTFLVGLAGGGIAHAAGKHGGGGPQSSTMTCTASAAGVGAPLYVTGSGYRAGASYIVEFFWPNNGGEGVTSAMADSSGNIALSSYAYWSGSYTVNVAQTENGTPLATCATAVS